MIKISTGRNFEEQKIHHNFFFQHGHQWKPKKKLFDDYTIVYNISDECSLHTRYIIFCIFYYIGIHKQSFKKRVSKKKKKRHSQTDHDKYRTTSMPPVPDSYLTSTRFLFHLEDFLSKPFLNTWLSKNQINFSHNGLLNE